MSTSNSPFVVSFCGNSGVGKTTLICALLAHWKSMNLRVGVIKHSSGFPDADTPGKDSHRLRAAGAERLVLGSPGATVAWWAHESDTAGGAAAQANAEPDFPSRLKLLGEGLDLVLVESWNALQLPTIEVMRSGHTTETRFRGDDHLIAVAADFPSETCPMPRFDLSDIDGLSEFLLGLRNSAAACR